MTYVTEPTEEWPDGSVCPVHGRVHDAHGWYVCLPVEEAADGELQALRRMRGRVTAYARRCAFLGTEPTTEGLRRAIDG